MTSAPAVVYISKLRGEYAATFVSENVKTLWGYDPEEFLENPNFWLKNIHPDDIDDVHSKLSELESEKHFIFEYRFKVKDGTYHWMRDTVQIIFDQEGNPIETIGYVIDITETKKAELKLKESEEKYRLITENAHDFLESLIDKYIAMVNFLKKVSGNTDNGGYTWLKQITTKFWVSKKQPPKLK